MRAVSLCTCTLYCLGEEAGWALRSTSNHCNKLQHAATHCNTLQRVHFTPSWQRKKDVYTLQRGTWMSLVTCMIEACHPYEWGVSHVWMRLSLHVYNFQRDKRTFTLFRIKKKNTETHVHSWKRKKSRVRKKRHVYTLHRKNRHVYNLHKGKKKDTCTIFTEEKDMCTIFTEFTLVAFVYPLDVCTMVDREVGGWGRDPFSRNLMSPTPRRKWYLTTGRRFH